MAAYAQTTTIDYKHSKKLLFVSPTDTSGTDSAAGAQAVEVAGVAGEVASDVDVGVFNFIAVGALVIIISPLRRA